ncbi:MAG: hypothetical protein R3D55_26840 [Chloroflexota bacterium]
MSELIYHAKRNPIPAVLLAVPLFIFALLQLTPGLNIDAWSLSWYTHLIQYYFGAFASFMALIAALFANSALGDKTTARSIFLTIGFIVLAALFLFSSLATPNILIEDPYNVAFTWSLRLGLPVSSLFFAASAVNWPSQFERRLIRYRRLFWLMVLLFLLVFGFIVFGLSDLSQPLCPVRSDR